MMPLTVSQWALEHCRCDVNATNVTPGQSYHSLDKSPMRINTESREVTYLMLRLWCITLIRLESTERMMAAHISTRLAISCYRSSPGCQRLPALTNRSKGSPATSTIISLS